jgi:hypothetical protein
MISGFRDYSEDAAFFEEEGIVRNNGLIAAWGTYHVISGDGPVLK